ncbi:unnamed protein product [Acanthoscelides obtectus]|uniref:Uncharacterized protein n=1 Tax=Acanthoscelides obtectus TaxID=200917 RepID=A0A9P0L9E4_ACAOB|nr:unnamed protein product [Acanthoscelides obtectus]CAK1630598.1 hypothetical protein AOBTE_LOCUS6434 [Acanthoscelides obtectus]
MPVAVHRDTQKEKWHVIVAEYASSRYNTNRHVANMRSMPFEALQVFSIIRSSRREPGKNLIWRYTRITK